MTNPRKVSIEASRVRAAVMTAPAAGALVETACGNAVRRDVSSTMVMTRFP
jgi:hypothetical protein